jgi:hypothetical protein
LVAIAVEIPTTSPPPLTSTPPEFPGLMAASVWMASTSSRSSPPFSPPGTFTTRCSADTIPVVTELWNPNGLPTTIAASPTRRSADRPTLATASPARPTLSTARS